VIWVAAGSLAGFVVFRQTSLGGSPRYWLAGGAAILATALETFGRSLPVFLALFLFVTLICGLAAMKGRLPCGAFTAFAFSDIWLGAAVTLQRYHSGSWSLPPAGKWGPAASLLAAAALMRLGAAARVNHKDEIPSDGAFFSIGWWQGVALAYLAGPAAWVLLALGGLGIWLAASGIDRRPLRVMAVAGGLVAVASGLGAGVVPLVIAGLAGVCLSAGVGGAWSIWTLAVLPLSAAAGYSSAAKISVSQLRSFGFRFHLQLGPTALNQYQHALFAASLVAFLAVWTILAQRLGSLRHADYKSPWEWIILGATAISTVFRSPGLAAWLGYGLTLAALTTFVLTKLAASTPALPMPDVAPPTAPAPPPIYSPTRAGRALLPFGWAGFSVALVVAVRLVFEGVSTGFL